MSDKKYTPDQLAAISAKGDTLVVAGAGAGKTGTLVERCIRLLAGGKPGKPGTPISKILVVTFTEAAAAEVRKRIREELEKLAAGDPSNIWLQEQIAGLDTAHICTLHSFCLALLRENFYALDLDPAVSVLPGEQAEMLFHEVFEEVLNEHFAGKHHFSGVLQQVIQTHFNGKEKGLREFIRKMHHYTQTRPDPEAWFVRQQEQLTKNGAATWRALLGETVKEWCAWWAPYLASLPAENENARFCADLLQAALASDDMGVVSAALARKDCWNRRKTKDSPAFGKFFEEAEFLDSLRDAGALEKDWKWHGEPLVVLLQFAKQFSERYEGEKRARGAVDFHDLEQGALWLLWTNETPTPMARRWQERIEAVFVDEYQDINAAQDKIIRAVSRDGEGNRFLVGDIKQSIYGFRQADPSIFRKYLQGATSGKQWNAIFLSDNFRSHEGILEFINPLFSWLMQEAVGGVNYDPRAALKFGAREHRTELALRKGERLPVELHVLLTSKVKNIEEDESEDLAASEIEARIVAARLRELKEQRVEIQHRKEGKRAVEWRDMVVLLRAASSKLEIYAKAFAAMGVPLDTRRDGFFSAQEVLDLCNLLTILDNPLQDIPLAAVLRSPFVGLSASDLASIRIHAPRVGNFWFALNDYVKKENEAGQKIQRFMERYHRWRDPRNCFSLAQRLEIILAESGYAEWLISQPRGRQRYANIQQLLRVARQFDDARGESLYLFLRHIQELQESAGDIEPASISEANAVRLMTVHQSKGLEFPVVAVADLGKAFNTSDQSSAIQLHEKLGICGRIQSPDAAAPYWSLPLWLASREQQLSGLGEEMRILYVALTRAENRLLLFGAASDKRPASWTEAGGALSGPIFPQHLLKQRSWLDWLGAHVSHHWPGCLAEAVLEGATSDAPFLVQIHHAAPASADAETATAAELSDAERSALLQRLTFEYPHAKAVEEPAKTSVSAVRKRLQDDEEIASPKRFLNLANGIDGRTRGVATHTFLEHVDLRGDFSERGLRKQAQNLLTAGALSKEELGVIDWDAIGAFWESEFGREIRDRWVEVRRELPFTFKLTSENLPELGLQNVLPVPAGEFIVTQGVADLVVLGPTEIWLVDFKTDAVKRDEVASKAAEYRAQIALYGLALERIYGRPVTRRALYFVGARKLHWME